MAQAALAWGWCVCARVLVCLYSLLVDDGTVPEWKNPWDKWFGGSQTDLSWKCPDGMFRRIARINRPSFGKSGPREMLTLTYQQLHGELQKFANVTTSLGVKKRGQVVIYRGITPAEPLDAEHPLFLLYTSGTPWKPKGSEAGNAAKEIEVVGPSLQLLERKDARRHGEGVFIEPLIQFEDRNRATLHFQRRHKIAHDRFDENSTFFL